MYVHRKDNSKYLDKNIFANKLHISENIRRARVSAGKTQAELANILGVARSTYANWEAGTEPDIDTLRRISQILDVSLSLILSEPAVLATEQPASYNYVSSRRKLKTEPKAEQIPIYDVPIDASFLERYRDDGPGMEPVGFLNIPKLRNCNFAAVISGNSMYPIMKSGTGWPLTSQLNIPGFGYSCSCFSTPAPG